MIMSHKKKKIALIGYRLSGGGSDRVMANLSIFFQHQGFEVNIIIVLDEVSFPYLGKLVNLGLLKNKSNGIFNKAERLWALRKYLNENEFDFIIDFRFRTKIIQELVLARFIYNTKTIFTVHSFLIDHYMPNNSWLTRLMYNYCFANVAITNEMKTLIEKKHQLKNVVTIHNPIYLEEIIKEQNEKIELEFDFIIAIGQYENGIKQFDKLISAYAQSDLSQKQIHFVIIGNGDEAKLNKAILENNISGFVHLLGYQNNPFKYLSKAKFLVLSSKNEGFPNVILEALACEIPVVCFDCDFGPRDMITSFKNGILVENQNWEKLSEAMNLFVSDSFLYQSCKENTLRSIDPFLLEKIGQEWLHLLKAN
ncbi:N-acetylgalactosamine-N,N'-diacetylbacillosaminyl-diphospho-undecaprenol 4-alpha-N-acetylgalactosaminyltransferase [Flavobacterium saccharophilum]|uniref:N-acetylgalactosamine-N,N'-diacetylbacillosaminyl-diphospho-undecaprenol 4-alpha-N-acetylgalactosaminyltransferase n=2 Tax=Flavobacterium saccharophilum TaxID=29534 RepID=A0A1M7M3C6_9FLAO|nr:N-acetylgalactosamine-N,N'-diacetylbacillosaminyl-diphospho-undecaprenol 4-alpha-N-acetylgalactosaminyltransferase [Flavobacterium saccharophilum]